MRRILPNPCLAVFLVFHSLLTVSGAEPPLRQPPLMQRSRRAERSVDDLDYDVPNDGNKNKPSGGYQGSRIGSQGPVVRRRSAEHLLHAMLFAPGRYQKNVRPLNDHSRSITVRVGVCVMTIDEIKWNDEFLRWRPSDYKNLSWMALPSSEIWIPDIALINSPDPYYITRKEAFSEVRFDGAVGYYPSGRFQTRCQISLTYFPFDQQHCDLHFESWVYPVEMLSIEPWSTGNVSETVDMKDYYRNHQWDLKKFGIMSKTATYDGLQFSAIRIRFYFERRTLYYLVLSIFPCLIMSVLQMFSHTLPVEHPARMTLLTSLFVSSSVIQSSLASQMPKSSDGVSLIQLYLMIFSTNLLISMLITFMNMHVWFRVPMSMVPSCHRMMRAFFLDTGKPQKPPATAASAVAAISAAAMPLVPMSASLSKPAQPPRRPKMTSLVRKISHRLTRIASSPRTAHRPTTQTQEITALFDQEAVKPSPQADRSSNSPVWKAQAEASSTDEDSELDIPQSSLTAVAHKHVFDYTYHYSEEEEPSDPDVNGEIVSPQSKVQRRRSSGPRQRNVKQRSGASRLTVPRPATPPPPPPPLAQANRSTGNRRGAVIALKPQGQQEHVPNVAERKDRWLQFSMLIDKVFLYAMLVYNLLCPVVIFGLVPQIQMFYITKDEEEQVFDVNEAA